MSDQQRVYIVTVSEPVYGWGEQTYIHAVLDSEEKAQAMCFDVRVIHRGKNKGKVVKTRKVGYDYEVYYVE